jgi:hypothetical protein
LTSQLHEHTADVTDWRRIRSCFIILFTDTRQVCRAKAIYQVSTYTVLLRATGTRVRRIWREDRRSHGSHRYPPPLVVHATCHRPLSAIWIYRRLASNRVFLSCKSVIAAGTPRQFSKRNVLCVCLWLLYNAHYNIKIHRRQWRENRRVITLFFFIPVAATVRNEQYEIYESKKKKKSMFTYYYGTYIRIYKTPIR